MVTAVGKRLRFWCWRVGQLWRRSYWGQPSDPTIEPAEWDQAAP